MDASKSKIWPYAVVEFLDSTYSEIPIIWLVDKPGYGSQCWWPPRTANCPQMIANYTTPDHKTWNYYDVKIIKFCTSLESARKHAADAKYTTTDEEQLGRGRREHVPCSRFDSDKEELENKPRKVYTKKKLSSTIVSKPPLCPDNFEFSKKRINDDNNEVAISQQEKRFDTVSKQSSNLDLDVQANNVAAMSQEKDNIPFNEEKWEDIPILQGTCIKNADISSIKSSLEQVLQLQAKCNLDIKDIKQRLIKLENKNRALNPLDIDDSLIVQLLPLITINNIKEFDSMLKTSDEAVTQFKRFISRIGGNNPRDNIHRTLKKIFTDGCAMNCSWKGVRNHFRLDNLQLVTIIKRQITLRHMALTETEFDNIVAEWFRFAKQRQRRAEKGKDKEDQREEKTREDKEKEVDKENEKRSIEAQKGDQLLINKVQNLNDINNCDEIFYLSGAASKNDMDDLNLDNTENKPPEKKRLLDKFNILPKRKVDVSKQLNILRKVDEAKLNALDCWECKQYYKNLSLSEGELQERMNQCSRHRHKYKRSNTPEARNMSDMHTYSKILNLNLYRHYQLVKAVEPLLHIVIIWRFQSLEVRMVSLRMGRSRSE